MKIVLLYLRIIKRADPSLPELFPYKVAERRWIETYKRFRPEIPHRVVIVNCGSHTEYDEEFDEVAHSYAYYDGQGSDCGTFQAIGQTQDCDLVICCNTIAYFWRPGWMEPFAAAAEKCGPGVYGATASLQGNPHLRTPCIAFHPRVLREYPVVCNSRHLAIQFESGRNNISLWAQDHGYPALLVTEAGVYQQHDWRTPRDIFRRGDQSNCLVWDRHTQVYAEADIAMKQILEAQADGLKP